MKHLFCKQREYISYFFDNIDIKKAEEILEVLSLCKGNIIFTGVGKSGFIANKVAMTMLSTGTKALYLDPIDAVHGDVGMVGKDDVVVVFSKSGETKELRSLLPHVKAKNAKVIAIVSNKDSSLKKEADYYMFLPVKKEICPFNLAPTTSAVVQLLFGDILTVSLMKNNKFSLDEYAKNHPSGSIGKKITYKVEDIMIKGNDIPICKPKNRLMDVLSILSEKKCGCLVVVDDNRNLLGIFTDGDLRRTIEKGRKFLDYKMEDLMTKNPKATNPYTLAWDAMCFMEKDQKSLIMVLPVVDKQKLVGIIKLHDIIQEGIRG